MGKDWSGKVENNENLVSHTKNGGLEERASQFIESEESKSISPSASLPHKFFHYQSQIVPEKQKVVDVLKMQIEKTYAEFDKQIREIESEKNASKNPFSVARFEKNKKKRIGELQTQLKESITYLKNKLNTESENLTQAQMILQQLKDRIIESGNDPEIVRILMEKKLREQMISTAAAREFNEVNIPTFSRVNKLKGTGGTTSGGTNTDTTSDGGKSIKDRNFYSLEIELDFEDATDEEKKWFEMRKKHLKFGDNKFKQVSEARKLRLLIFDDKNLSKIQLLPRTLSNFALYQLFVSELYGANYDEFLYCYNNYKKGNSPNNYKALQEFYKNGAREMLRNSGYNEKFIAANEDAYVHCYENLLSSRDYLKDFFKRIRKESIDYYAIKSRFESDLRKRINREIKSAQTQKKEPVQKQMARK